MGFLLSDEKKKVLLLTFEFPPFPGGIGTLVSFLSFSRPEPLHSEHGVSIDSPRPRHVGHVWATLMNPPIDLTTCPCPPQVPHLMG